jgi:hypothetical protein
MFVGYMEQDPFNVVTPLCLTLRYKCWAADIPEIMILSCGNMFPLCSSQVVEQITSKYAGRNATTIIVQSDLSVTVPSQLPTSIWNSLLGTLSDGLPVRGECDARSRLVECGADVSHTDQVVGSGDQSRYFCQRDNRRIGARTKLRNSVTL